MTMSNLHGSFSNVVIQIKLCIDFGMPARRFFNRERDECAYAQLIFKRDRLLYITFGPMSSAPLSLRA